MDLTEKYDVQKVIPHESRDDISIDRLEVSCPENRFNKCTKWKTFKYPAMQVELSRYFVMKFCAE